MSTRPFFSIIQDIHPIHILLHRSKIQIFSVSFSCYGSKELGTTACHHTTGSPTSCTVCLLQLVFHIFSVTCGFRPDQKTDSRSKVHKFLSSFCPDIHRILLELRRRLGLPSAEAWKEVFHFGRSSAAQERFSFSCHARQEIATVLIHRYIYHRKEKTVRIISKRLYHR